MRTEAKIVLLLLAAGVAASAVISMWVEYHIIEWLWSLIPH